MYTTNMIAEYYQYNRLNPVIALFQSRINEMRYRHYASDLLDRLFGSPDFDLDNSVRKAIAIFRLTGIPVQEHIWGVYRSEPDGVKRDWRLSELACSLIILSCSPLTDEMRNIQCDLLKYIINR